MTLHLKDVGCPTCVEGVCEGGCKPAKGQSFKGSWTETFVNTGIGYSINFCAQCVVFPLFGMHVTYASQFGIGAIFTVISIVRGYCLRRGFNWLHVKGIL